MPKKITKKTINQVAGASPGTAGNMAVWKADLAAIVSSTAKALSSLGEAAAMTVELAVDGGVKMPDGIPGL